MTQAMPDWATAIPSAPVHNLPTQPGGSTLPFTQAQLLEIGAQLIEQFLQKVVLGLVGTFIPGAGTALEQLRAWGLDLESLVADLTNGLNQIFAAFEGIDLSSPGAVVDSMQALLNAFALALLSLLGNAPIVGPPIEALGGFMLQTFNNGVDALQATGGLTNQVGSLQNQVNAPVSLPIAQSAHDGEASVTWEVCDTNITITPTTGKGAYTRVKEASEKRTATIVAYKGTGVTGLYFDLVKLDPVTGIATRMYQSVNEAANLASGTTAADYVTLVHTMPVEAAVVVNTGEYWGWQITTVGGNITVRGRTDTNPALETRPKRRGWVLATRPGTTIDQTAMDAAFNTSTIYVEFDRVAEVEPIEFYDDFERAVL